MRPPIPARAIQIFPLLSALALLAALLSGCTTRDRSNPLDPRNRATRGLLVGFNALAGDAVVELRWPRLTQQGVLGYRVERWRPGASPAPLAGAEFAAHVGSAEDLTAENDSTYVYRLVARLASGDSAVSPPDTATPGTRRIVALVAELPGLVGLTADARDRLYEFEEKEPYDDVALDESRGWFWLSLFDRGVVVRRRFDGTTVGTEMQVAGPSDLTVTPQRGTGWAAVPSLVRVVQLGPDTLDPNPGSIIVNVGVPRVVEGAAATATVWIGSDGGDVYRYSVTSGGVTETWRLGDPIAAIALDEAADAAWVATRYGDLSDLYYVLTGSPDPPVRVREGLLNVTDLELDRVTRALWISERGAPLTGNGRLTRIARTGETLATLLRLEPFGLAMEPRSNNCWVTDLASDRLLEVTPNGTIARRSPPLGVPYGLRIHRP
jgi:hypothetical protein